MTDSYMVAIVEGTQAFLFNVVLLLLMVKIGFDYVKKL